MPDCFAYYFQTEKSNVEKHGHMINFHESFKYCGFYHVLVSKIPWPKFHACVEISSIMKRFNILHLKLIQQGNESLI